MGFIKEVLMDWFDINEFHNARIDVKDKRYTDTISCNEEFYIMAKTNADDGDEINIELNIFDKNKALLKKVDIESYVENEEVKETLKIEDLALKYSLKINDIKEVHATIVYEKDKYPTNKAHIYRTLKSKELRDSGILNDIVEDKEKRAFKKTTPLTEGEDVKLIQESLQKMGINIGDDGIDGKFGGDGESAVQLFQESYEPIHNTHQYIWSEPDGVAGKNTILAMDEALINDWKYVSTCFCNRDITVLELEKILNKRSLFSWSNCPIPTEDRTYEKLAESLNKAMQEYSITTCIRKFHFLAQCYHESAHFKTTVEGGGSNASYAPYYGRGLIQLTFKSNYEKYGTYKNINFVESPEKLAENLEYSVDSSGWFWAKSSNSLNIEADSNDLIMITRKINGGFNGYNDRLKWFKKFGFKQCNAQGAIVKDFKFKDSAAFNDKRASFAWGLWHDSELNKEGCTKNNEKAIEGYKRFIELTSSSYSNTNWYNIKKASVLSSLKYIKNNKEYIKVRKVAELRLKELQGE